MPTQRISPIEQFPGGGVSPVHLQKFLACFLVLLHAFVVVRRTLLSLGELGGSIEAEDLAHLNLVLVGQQHGHTVERHLLEKEERCRNLVEKWNMKNL